MSYNLEDARQQRACYYNDSIDCERRMCSRCGWNPSVFERRKVETQERIKEEYGVHEVIKIRRAAHEGNL